LGALETGGSRVRDSVGARHHEERAVQLISEIYADGPNRGGVAHAEADGMREVVEFVVAMGRACGDAGAARVVGIRDGCEGGPRQRSAEADAAHATVNISSIVEQGAAQLGAQIREAHRKTKLLVQCQQRLTANGEAGGAVAWTSLIQRKSAKRCSAAG